MRRILFAIVIVVAALVVGAPVVSAQAPKGGTAAKSGTTAKSETAAKSGPAVKSGTVKSGTAVKARATAASPVNLNSASVAQLQTLPGIGASAAQRIVDYRQKNGAFKKIEELMNVKGIGEKSFLKLKPLITVGADKGEHASGDK